MPLNKDLKEFIELLNSNEVEYVVVGAVGAFAVAWYGYARYTADLDILVRPGQPNNDRVLTALGQFGFSGLGVSASDLADPDRVIELGVLPNRIYEFAAMYTHWKPGTIRRSSLVLLVFALLSAAAAAQAPQVFVDDGGWCWFQDERVIVHNNKLIIGTVAAGTKAPQRKGNIEVTVVDPASKARTTTVLHAPADSDRRRWLDDHNSPAFFARPDNRVLAMYSLHGVDEKIYYRISEPGDATRWGPEQIYVPSQSSRITYANLHYLSAEKRLYDFFRGLHNSFKPSYIWSGDLGSTWNTGNVYIDVPSQFRHRPYVKYASNGRDTVHMAYTEGHPRDFDNSIYHISYKGGALRRSDGTVIRSLKEGLAEPGAGTLVYRGGAANVAWISDLHLDPRGRPFLVFSVQRDSAGAPPDKDGQDHRYHYARWTGSKWDEHEIAYAGSRLYQGENDYTGNVCVDPQDPNTVVISTNADPVTGKRLPHRELYRGATRDGGAHFLWTALTRDSAQDNIRPIIPIRKGGPRVILWLRGIMRTYTDYDFEVVALTE